MSKTKTKTNILDPKLWLSDSHNTFSKPIAQVHEFYLSGPIEGPEEYVGWFDTIRNCGAQDIVKIYINSPGGDLSTALQFLRVIAESPAEVVCSVEGCCMSAATMIFLHADSHEITPHSTFMFHNYSSGTFGKGGEQYDQIQFERRWSEEFLRDVYRDFLTDLEIQSMLENKDIWMSYSEVCDRLEQLLEQRESRADADADADADAPVALDSIGE